MKTLSNSKILLAFIISGFAIPAFAGNPTAYLNFAAFSTPSGQNFFETYISVVGGSLNFVKKENNKYIAKAHITLAFKKGDSTYASANFNAVSPEITDTLNKPDFIDAHRFFLPKGNYTLQFTLDDPNDASHKTITGKQAIHVGYSSDTVDVSDAEFMSSFSESAEVSPYNKCGYHMVPYVFGDYPQNMKKICFYCEIYNTIKFIPREKFTIKYAIEDDGNTSINLASNFVSSSQRDADTVVPFMAQIPIDKLPSGSYYLVVSVINMNNHVLAKRKYPFTKENPGVKSTHIDAGFASYMANRDTLEECIRCLAPISKNEDQGYVMSDSLNYISMGDLKHWFYYFWVNRDSLHPLDAWEKYLVDVIKVNNSFSVNGQKGYRTDRGRIYLQYGPPNIRVVEKNNPATYPHEIWEYYKLPDGETDTKFVFFCKAIETNNYVLLHSTATGELHNNQWQSELYSAFGNGNVVPNNIDNSTVQDQLGEDVNDEFNNPH